MVAATLGELTDSRPNLVRKAVFRERIWSVISQLLTHTFEIQSCKCSVPCSPRLSFICLLARSSWHVFRELDGSRAGDELAKKPDTCPALRETGTCRTRQTWIANTSWLIVTSPLPCGRRFPKGFANVLTFFFFK